MIPFCRTLDEADKVLKVLSDNGLVRGRDGLEIFVMAEIPANVLLAEQFAERFDGFSIGSNDLTQLVLGVDRDSDVLSSLFDERNDAASCQSEVDRSTDRYVRGSQIWSGIEQGDGEPFATEIRGEHGSRKTATHHGHRVTHFRIELSTVVNLWTSPNVLYSEAGATRMTSGKRQSH